MKHKPLLKPRTDSTNLLKQKGMALLVVLLLIALMTTIGVLMNDRWFSQLKQTEYQQKSLQAKWYMQGAEEVIRGVLWRDLKDDETRTHLGQYWASDIKQFPLENALLKFEIKDAFSCLNLNAVAQIKEETEESNDTYIFDLFVNLFVQSGIDPYQSIELVVNLQDWVDLDEDIRPYGAEDTLYSGKNPPYLAANQPLIDISELRLIEGFTPDIMRKIMPYTCVLPESKLSINVNTLTFNDAKLLSSLSLGQWDEGFVQTILENRPKTGWSDLNAFYQEAGLVEEDPLKEKLETILVLNSQYFMARLSVQIEDSLFTNQSLFYRTNNGVSVIDRKAEAMSE